LSRRPISSRHFHIKINSNHAEFKNIRKEGGIIQRSANTDKLDMG
jgi:hypothetical protein